jgi:hypothetical protein
MCHRATRAELVAIICMIVFTGVRRAGAQEPSLRTFSNVVYVPTADVARELGVGWARAPFLWKAIQPTKDQWNWGPTDQIVQQAHSEGMEVLPLVAYTALWASNPPGQELSPPAHVEDWESFVEHVVARYSSPPYNLRYFQVWNEPTTDAFWKGQTNAQWVDIIYLPAARIIRQHHCYVVFGGWPDKHPIREYDQILMYNNTWQWTDILDVHYYGDQPWQSLYDEWLRTGKCRGIWQTEIGFTGTPGYLNNIYLRSMNWALQHGWGHPYDYRVFWYAWWGAGSNASLSTGPAGKNVLTFNGRSLALMNQVLGNGPLAFFGDFKTVPPLGSTLDENTPAALGFRVGNNRVVVALLVDKSTQSPVRVTLSLRKAPARVQLVTATGAEHPLNANVAANQVAIDVPIPQDCPCRFQLAYVQVDQ